METLLSFVSTRRASASLQCSMVQPLGLQKHCGAVLTLILFLPCSLSRSTQPPNAYTHPTSASYSVQPAAGVAHAVTASYAPAPSPQAARPAASTPYPGYQAQPAPEYTYRQQDPTPQPTSVPQTYQVFTEAVSTSPVANVNMFTL